MFKQVTMLSSSLRYYRKHKARQNLKNGKRNHEQKLRDPVTTLLRNVKCRAKQIGVPFNLEHSDIEIPVCCPVFGFDLKFTPGKVTNQTPSLDRIDPKKGYVSGNVRILSMRANVLRNNASIQELEQILAYMRTA